MERIISVYQREYNPKKPVVCVDESSKQHLLEVIKSLPTKPGHVSRYESEYIRGGVSNMFMFFEPLVSSPINSLPKTTRNLSRLG